jgi:hypothetical protein
LIKEQFFDFEEFLPRILGPPNSISGANEIFVLHISGKAQVSFSQFFIEMALVWAVKPCLRRILKMN